VIDRDQGQQLLWLSASGLRVNLAEVSLFTGVVSVLMQEGDGSTSLKT